MLIPGGNALRIEVHLFDDERSIIGTSGVVDKCKNYFILMISESMYLRSSNNYCSNDQLQSADFAKAVVNKINGILYKDMFYISGVNIRGVIRSYA